MTARIIAIRIISFDKQARSPTGTTEANLFLVVEHYVAPLCLSDKYSI
jgi:hypothetical protein